MTANPKSQIPNPKVQIPTLVLACLLGFSCVATAAERYAVIVSGASGDEKYAAQQEKWRSELAAFLTTTFAVPDANVVMLDEQSGGSSRATADNVRRLFGDLRRRVSGEDTVMVVLMGHGTFDGTEAKFNLVGPDIGVPEWKTMLDGIAGRLVVINTTESSFPFLEPLSRRGRVVITATDSAMQRFATVFPEYLVRALASLASDLDKNGRISVWEAFAAASAGVKQHYEQRGQLPTERPILDDDGDGMGREADAPGDDGAIARTLYLDPEPGTAAAGTAVAGLERQRAALERELETLKARKASMTDEEYQAELERILVELARLAQEIRRRS